MYSYQHPQLEKRSIQGKGVGLFAKAPLAKGVLLVVTGGIIIPTSALKTHPDPGHPFQLEKDFLLSPMEGMGNEGIFTVNHSCDPTAGVSGQVSLVAIRDIQKDEEITYDYVMTDSDPDGVETIRMTCLCGTEKCRGIVSDTDWRLPELQNRYRGYFSSYLRSRIKSIES